MEYRACVCVLCAALSDLLLICTPLSQLNTLSDCFCTCNNQAIAVEWTQGHLQKPHDQGLTGQKVSLLMRRKRLASPEGRAAGGQPGKCGFSLQGAAFYCGDSNVVLVILCFLQVSMLSELDW